MSAFAALAVASPVAAVAVTQLSGSSDAPQHREFVQAAMVTDLPSELMSALSQGLSSFGINLPPMPTGMLTGTPPPPTTLTTPGLGATGLTSPLTSPGLTTSPVLTPGADPAVANPALTNTALTSPAGELPGLTTTGLSTPGLTTPTVGLDPALTPISTGALPVPGEVPISAPLATDPALGTYPILGDPLMATVPTAPASTGLLGDLSSAANQLGAGQAIDLLKGVVVPAITGAIKSAAPPAAPPAGAPLPPPPAAPGM
jgi:hypothetical protein